MTLKRIKPSMYLHAKTPLDVFALGIIALFTVYSGHLDTLQTSKVHKHWCRHIQDNASRLRTYLHEAAF